MVSSSESMARPWVLGGRKRLWIEIQNKSSTQEAEEIQKQPKAKTDRRAGKT